MNTAIARCLHCILGTSVVAALFLPVVTEAGDDIACALYASNAVEQYRKALAGNCPGISGPRWSDDNESHYRWCLRVPLTQSEAEHRARENVLRECGGEPPRVPECEKYAGFAVGQNNENLWRDCGFVGAPWHSNYELHYAWCAFGNNRVLAERENKERARRLAGECPTGRGDLAAHGWCYELYEPPGQVAQIIFRPIVRNEGTRDWHSRKVGKYTVGATVGAVLTQRDYVLLGYPHWSLPAGGRYVLRGLNLPFAPDNVYTLFGSWILNHPDDQNNANNRLDSIADARGREFLDDGRLSFMRCKKGEDVWSAPPPPKAINPALQGFDNRLYLAALRSDGTVVVTATNMPGGWAPWRTLAGAVAAVDTAPQFFVDPATNTMQLLVRGRDNNLHVARKPAGAPWLAWSNVTSDAPARGRFSVVATQANAMAPSEFHVLFRSAGESTRLAVSYRRYSNSWLETQRAGPFNGFSQGVLGTDGADRILSVLQAERGLRVASLARPWTGGWQDITPSAVAAVNPRVLPSLDVSNVVYFDQAFHVMHTSERWDAALAADQRGQAMAHLRIEPNNPQGTKRSVVDATPLSAAPMRASIALYRQKLVAAYSDTDGAVRYARLDNADPTMPWLGREPVGTAPDPTRRPVLAAFDRRRAMPAPNYAQPNFGNDLFAAVSTAANSIAFIEFSRVILTVEAERQFTLYNSRSGAQCCDQDGTYGNLVCGAPVMIPDMRNDGRPFITELGYTLWTLPDWLVEGIFTEAARASCEERNSSGRFERPCVTARYPIVLKSSGGDHSCSGAWVSEFLTFQGNVFHELSHAILLVFGFGDSDGGPTADHAKRTGIDLAKLKQGFNIFGEAVNTDCLRNDANDTCPNQRAPGFVGGDRNYNASARQHAFIGVLTAYYWNGDQLRTWINQDLQGGNDLLRRKYDWIKNNIYRGVEFRTQNEPF